MMTRSKIVVGIFIALISTALLASAWLIQQQEGHTSDNAQELTATAAALRELKEKSKLQIIEKGADQAYASFLQSVPSNSIDPHSQVHAFGEALYEVKGLDGLSACDSSFEFGCYHSFFGVAVYAEGIEVLPQFDEACRKKYGSQNLPCEHGIGHGVLVYTDYENIVDALELCETVSVRPTGGCTSGVFMEYNFHTMDDVQAGEYIRDVGENLYEPCDQLPERFRASCYFEQVQWWQNIFANDFKHIGELCSKLDEDSAEYVACYNGIGNYVSAFAEFEYNKIVETCSGMPTQRARGLCHEGATWLVRIQEGAEGVPEKLCEALEEPYRSECFQKLQF
jgi:hypothetical protein